MKMLVRRCDIWMADLPWRKGDVLWGVHPAIVVSSDRTNRRSGVVTVVPLTSASKPPMPSHVVLSGYGLKKRSVALAEQLTTVPKDCLCRWIGSLAGSEKMAEVERAVKEQLEVA